MGSLRSESVFAGIAAATLLGFSLYSGLAAQPEHGSKPVEAALQEAGSLTGEHLSIDSDFDDVIYEVHAEGPVLVMSSHIFPRESKALLRFNFDASASDLGEPLLLLQKKLCDGLGPDTVLDIYISFVTSPWTEASLRESGLPEHDPNETVIIDAFWEGDVLELPLLGARQRWANEANHGILLETRQSLRGEGYCSLHGFGSDFPPELGFESEGSTAHLPLLRVQR